MNAIAIFVFVATLTSDDFCSKRLNHLLALHREYGLTLPPSDAVLVKVRTRPQNLLAQGHFITNPGDTFLAFTLDGRTIWPDRHWKLDSFQCASPDDERLRRIESVDLFELALVAHKRGWEPLARHAIRKYTLWLSQFLWPDLERDLGWDAARYWEERVYTEPDMPLSVIAKYLKRTQHCSLEPARTRALLRSVELALIPRNSKPGSDDALIDALLGLTGGAGNDDGGPGGYRHDPRYRAILRRGLDIVPALIANLNDDRITRARGRGCGDDHRTVKGVILMIISDLRGGCYTLEDYPLNQQLREIGKWFADAHKLGEEKYLVSLVVGKDEDSFFNPTLLWILAEKYPQRLPDIFRKVIDTRPDQHDDALHYAKAIAEAPIPLADKLKILEYAASQSRYSLREAGTAYLHRLDPKFKQQFLRELAGMPIDPKESQTGLAGVVAGRSDAAEWKTLALVVRRANPTSRVYLLDEISRAEGLEGRKHRLAFLAEYLTDDAWVSARFHLSEFWRYEVRNFAAMQLATLLKLEEQPEEDWTVAQWAELRAKVRAKVKEELRR